MTKRISSLMLSILLIASMVTDTFAAYMPRTKTPDYKVAFYAFDCYHMQDENGKRSGYGYEMMQGLSKSLQCTFSYFDIYAAARKTPEREQEFAFSTHPAITSSTCTTKSSPVTTRPMAASA